MSASFGIQITDLREDECDLTGKTAECVVYTVNGDSEAVISTARFFELLRMQKKQQRRKPSAGATGSKS